MRVALRRNVGMWVLRVLQANRIRAAVVGRGAIRGTGPESRRRTICGQGVVAGGALAAIRLLVGGRGSQASRLVAVCLSCRAVPWRRCLAWRVSVCPSSPASLLCAQLGAGEPTQLGTVRVQGLDLRQVLRQGGEGAGGDQQPGLHGASEPVVGLDATLQG